MEIQDLNIICDFEAGMNCLQNPSLFSRFFSLSGGTGEVFSLHSFWKWGALILAFVATFTRIKLLVFRLFKILDSSVPPIEKLDENSDSDDESDEDNSCSSAESDDDEDYSRTSSFRDRRTIDEDFRVAGAVHGMRLRRRRSSGRGRGDGFSWSDFPSGKSVVKLWDSFKGLGFDFEDDSSESVVSIWDLDRDRKISSFSGGRHQIPAASTSSPAVFFTAGSSENNSVVLEAYDTRVGGQVPAVYAEWPARRGKVADFGVGGVDKVYVRDDVTGELTVGDLRRVGSPLENLTESDGDTWWDADAVTDSDEF